MSTKAGLRPPTPQALPSVFYCTHLNREASHDDCHCCELGVTCAGIPSRLMLINRQAPAKAADPELAGRNIPARMDKASASNRQASREERRSGDGSGVGGVFLSPPRSGDLSPARPAPRLKLKG